jgi:hypothetical protein
LKLLVTYLILEYIPMTSLVLIYILYYFDIRNTVCFTPVSSLHVSQTTEIKIMKETIIIMVVAASVARAIMVEGEAEEAEEVVEVVEVVEEKEISLAVIWKKNECFNCGN